MNGSPAKKPPADQIAMPDQPWHYLILTASNEAQAEAYRVQLELRRRLGQLGQFAQSIVVPDPGGRRIGSGGSTICCLLEVLRRELAGRGDELCRRDAWLEILRRRRILIVHAGGDSRRLPAYGPCGKAFVPVPGTSDAALGMTLFDRQLPTYLALPPGLHGHGQVVITAGDVLLRFDPREVAWSAASVCGLGCLASPEAASRHGVFCLSQNDQLRRFLQKPSPEAQVHERAINTYGQSILDMGVFSLDAESAVRLLELSGAGLSGSGTLEWSGPVGREIEDRGLDFYREIACAFGTDSTLENYGAAVRSGGSRWSEAGLGHIYRAVHWLACRVHVVKQCEFLHFGTSRQIIQSGRQLLRSQSSFNAAAAESLSMNSRVENAALLRGDSCWIEGSSIREPVALGGENLLIGVDVEEPLELPQDACLDVLPGHDRAGQPVAFVRCYGIDDPLGGRGLCGQTLEWWAGHAGASAESLWDPGLPGEQRSLWNARVFPAEADAAAFRRWLWFFDPRGATPDEWEAWRAADRYSFEEMAVLADHEAFHGRRQRLHVESLQRALCRCFRHESGFSAADLAQAMSVSAAPETWVAATLGEARRRAESPDAEPVTEAFSFARTIHTLGSAVRQRAEESGGAGSWLKRVDQSLDADMRLWLDDRGLGLGESTDVESWTARAQALAFEYLRQKIVTSGRQDKQVLRSALRSDEIAWGRAPARLDLAGGWSDTPPYSLENGGTVLNAAVLLNGQPPVQVYGRVTAEPVIRLRSIDLGTHLDIQVWDELFDCSSAVGAFSLVKAALVISGFTPLSGGSERNRPLSEVLRSFGGGLEITTLAAIPKGSGLGTSSIMGAVLLAVINRMMGRTLSSDELFHNVLRLEQELTTGGGWQDQIGGSIGGLKLATSAAGLVPEATIRYLPADVLDPRLNGGQTLLYYTGMTRLAKNILQNVVGRYLDRDRAAMSALGQLGSLAARMAETIGRKDIRHFGRLIDAAWDLNLQLDPHSTTPEIEELLARIRPHIYGAKLLGAGGGGFLFLVARSSADAAHIARLLDESPPNERARFFDFQVSDCGLAVSVC
jgi:galactokinase/mevalonate kinase-like predicted kinase